MKDFVEDEGIAATENYPGRRLSANILSLFRAVDKKGLRGFLEGGVLKQSSPLTCAVQCDTDPLCLSFDFETITHDCYISHTDRYAHPEAFLDFPTGVYFEWQGVVDTPEIEPNGGQFNTQVVVRLLTAKLGAAIHYRIVPSTQLATTNLTAVGLFGSGKNFSIAASGDVITLPTYSCKIFAVAVKEGMNDSVVVISNEFKIFPSKYVYLVPYFNSNFHGRVTRIELGLKGKKRPRPARFLEFSDYETPNGIGPYNNQVAVIDLATLDPSFKGFCGGFTAFSNVSFVNETFLVPAADDPNYKTTAWKVILKAQYTASPTHLGFGKPAEMEQAVEYLYLIPYNNGTAYASKVLRIMALTFSSKAPIVEILDLSAVDKSLKGFGSAFTYGSYGYLVPRKNENGLFGKLARFRTDIFTPSSVEVLDLAAINSRYVGFSSAITYGNQAYLVPFRRPLTGDERTMNLREFPASNSGLVVRVNLNTFRVSGSLDLALFHPDLCGFSGAVTVTHFAYFVPYMRVRQPDSEEVSPYSGLVARVDLRDFTSVQFLDLTIVDTGLRGFMRGFAYRQYVFLVPHRWKFFDPKGPTQSGKVARIDTNDFTPSGISFLDLTAALRSQVPDFADSDLRGFHGGVVSGKYGFFVPYFNGATFSGKVCRINLDKFDEVQTLDLTQLDSKLRGFSDGILSKVQETLEANLFDEFQIRVGTTDPYDYTY
ncbi:PAN domain [Phytophthora infestans]|uniref:PAN domain n=1 Tax=Phytophthora infestans TaxID=4787 RepID=A0A8S9UES2_PHYIN|nr:PAN domain [Phytophthora infestans]